MAFLFFFLTLVLLRHVFVSSCFLLCCPLKCVWILPRDRHHLHCNDDHDDDVGSGREEKSWSFFFVEDSSCVSLDLRWEMLLLCGWRIDPDSHQTFDDETLGLFCCSFLSQLFILYSLTTLFAYFLSSPCSLFVIFLWPQKDKLVVLHYIDWLNWLKDKVRKRKSCFFSEKVLKGVMGSEKNELQELLTCASCSLTSLFLLSFFVCFLSWDADNEVESVPFAAGMS